MCTVYYSLVPYNSATVPEVLQKIELCKCITHTDSIVVQHRTAVQYNAAPVLYVYGIELGP
jgi:hypothetical protein